MAVLKALPEKVIPYLFPLLQRQLIVPLLVTRLPGDNFKGSQGDTLTMKLGQPKAVARKYDWRTRTNPIVLDDIGGGGKVDITFGVHTYSATGLTDEHMTMDEIELVREVVGPQTTAVALDLEADVVAAFAGLLYREEVDFTEGDPDTEISDPYKVAINAGMALDRQKRAPQSGRVWLVGANVAGAILKSDRFSNAALSGDTFVPTALSSATIGTIANIRVVRSLEVDPDFSVITHTSCLVLGTVAPQAPRGAAFSAAASADGFAMRWLMDYDSNFLRDRSIISLFSGISKVYDEIHLTGAKKGEIKEPGDYTNIGDDVPKSARAVKVNFTAAA